jgi:hypothetical protein
MRFRLFALLSLGLLGAQSANAVVIDGKDWRQLTETTGFSWLIVNSACGAGVCSGSIGDVSVDGWHWATNGDVQGLFEALIKPESTQFPTATTSYIGINDIDVANAVTNVFDPTWVFPFGNSAYRDVRGLTRSEANGLATMAYLSDSPFLTGPDYAAFDTLYPTNLGHFSTGIWLFKPVEAPEPGTVALMGAGLVGLALVRRRRAHAAAHS